MARRPLVAGNWKMHGVRAALGEVDAIARARDDCGSASFDVVVCPPATLLAAACERARGSRIAIGAQDCHERESGPFTGSVSAQMLRDAGAEYVILGHSERRRCPSETDAVVRAKAATAARAGLTPIICVGETREERAAGRTHDVLESQVGGSTPPLDVLVVAYEPVWAIGSGETPSPDEISAAHATIRKALDAIAPNLGATTRVLYGGSVAPANAATLLTTPEVDGALVGGASLTARDFTAIWDAYRS